MRVLFFGSSEYCLPILDALATTFSLVGVVTREDKPVGRKKELTQSEPKRFAKKANIPVFIPKDADQLLSIYNTLGQFHPDISVVADYGMMIPEEIFTIPKHQTINIHFSKLPQFRGAAPVQYTILRGDSSAWITIQKLEKELDTGDILWQREEQIGDADTTEGLYRKLFTIVAKELPDVLKQYAGGTIALQPQENSQATYTRRLTRADGYIPWEVLHPIINNKQLTIEQLDTWPLYISILKNLYTNQQPITNNQQLVHRVFRAFSPWPGLWTLLRPSGFGGQAEIEVSRKQYAGSSQNMRLKILGAHLEPPTADRLLNTGKLVIDEVQLEGKQPVTWQQFQDAYPLLEER